MSSTVLQLVQEFADKFSLPSPNALIGSTDKGIRQYRAILNEVIRDMSEYRWPQQRLQKDWLAGGSFNPNYTISTTLFGIPNATAFDAGLNPNEFYLHGQTAGTLADVNGSVLIAGVPITVQKGVVYTSNPGNNFIAFDASGTLFPNTNLPNSVAMVRLVGTQWQYDPNGSWVNFTPTASQYIIGAINVVHIDDNLTPGIIGLNLWASALPLTQVSAVQDQGALTTIFGAAYQTLEQGTMWNRTRRMRVYGPLSDQVWQALSVLPNAGPEFQYWISGGHLYISPAPQPGETLTAVYWTKAVILDVDGVTTKSLITADTDTLLFPDNVVLRCFEAKWKKQKGEAGWEDIYNDYMVLLARNIVKDTATRIAMDTTSRYPQPGIIVPAGSWNV